MKETAALPILLAVGVPVEHKHQLYNCAAFLLKGELLGLVPQRNIPTIPNFTRPVTSLPARLWKPLFTAGRKSLWL